MHPFFKLLNVIDNSPGSPGFQVFIPPYLTTATWTTSPWGLV